MLIGALVDRGSGGQSSSQPAPPQQQQPYYPDEKRQPQDDRLYMRQQGQPGMVVQEWAQGEGAWRHHHSVVVRTGMGMGEDGLTRPTILLRC
jgi:hypothetical protein